MHAIVVMALVSLVVTVVAGSLTARSTAVRAAALATQTTYAAESGVASAVAAWRAGADRNAPHRGAVGGCAFEVVGRARPARDELEVTSTGTCAGRRQTVTWVARGAELQLAPLAAGPGRVD